MPVLPSPLLFETIEDAPYALPTRPASRTKIVGVAEEKRVAMPHLWAKKMSETVQRRTNTMKCYRQGDVLIRKVRAIPPQEQKLRSSGILAFGEVTGHCHKVEDLELAEVLEVGNDLYLRVSEDGVRIVHDEHDPIALPKGNYEVVIQREYSPEAIRNVAD